MAVSAVAGEFYSRAVDFRRCRTTLQEAWQSSSTGALDGFQSFDLILPPGCSEHDGSYRQQGLHDGLPVSGVDDLYLAAQTTQRVLSGFLQEMMETLALPVTLLRLAPLKGKARAVEKAKDDYSDRPQGPGIAWLFDIVRGCVDCASEEQIESIMRYLAEPKTCCAISESGDITTHRVSVIRLKNRFLSPTPGGFRDINMNLMVELGVSPARPAVRHICELQVHLEPLHHLAESLHSHATYEFFRVYFRGDQKTVDSRLALLDQIVPMNGHADADADAHADSKEADSSHQEGHSVEQRADDSHSANERLRSVVVAVLESGDASRLIAVEKLLDLMCCFDLLLTVKQWKLTQAESELKTVLDTAPERIKDSVLEVTSLLVQEAAVYSTLCKYQAAHASLSRAFTLSEQHLGPNHAQTLTISIDLAITHEYLGSTGMAFQLLQRAARGLTGVDDGNALRAVTRVARLIQAIDGDPNQAMVYFEHSLAGLRKMMGSDHPTTLEASDHLVAFYLSGMNIERAEELLQQSLELRVSSVGWDHDDTLSNLNNLSSIFMMKRQYGQARDMLAKAVASIERARGPHHMITLFTITNLAEARIAAQDPDVDGTVALAERAAQGLTALLGPRHIQTERAVCVLECSRPATTRVRAASNSTASSSTLGFRRSDISDIDSD